MSGDSPFWRFSLGFYARPGVAPACLALQDEGGADVNLLLFLLFLAERGRTVASEDVARLDASIASWRVEVVEPLRALRRRLKGGVGEIPPATSEGLRTMLKKLELEAERLEQALLETYASAFVTTAPPEDAARGNLMAYSAYLGGLPEGPLGAVISAFSARKT